MSAADDALALHLAEYGSLRAEIMAQQRVRTQTLQFGVGAIAAIWAFLATETLAEDVSPLALAAWWIPCFVAAAGLALNFAASAGVKQAGAYLALIEERYADEALGGWERTLIRGRDDLFSEADRGRFPPFEERDRLRYILWSREISGRVSRVIRLIWVIVLAVSALVAAAANALIAAHHRVESVWL